MQYFWKNIGTLVNSWIRLLFFWLEKSSFFCYDLFFSTTFTVNRAFFYISKQKNSIFHEQRRSSKGQWEARKEEEEFIQKFFFIFKMSSGQVRGSHQKRVGAYWENHFSLFSLVQSEISHKHEEKQPITLLSSLNYRNPILSVTEFIFNFALV